MIMMLHLTPVECSETDGNKDSMWWRWLRQLHCPHLKIWSFGCKHHV